MDNYKEDTFKPTDLDYMTGDSHLQMMKAALPYMGLRQQRMLSLFVRIQEMNRTMRMFSQGEMTAMNAAPETGGRHFSVSDMLEAIKPYGNTYEQEIISLISNMAKGVSAPMEQLKSFLSPEQQSRIDAMQFMMQAMQNMN
ncbi:hypothetical protein AALB16_03780 [Lachnospiraceae bacterium 62-35]